ncbi:SURF1 family protein [Streptomyces meridianus]|uniref:SURF1-like protein n=1 Tax=Streptomyces meridianus TaxID=2938945 RepID=A0ABT0X5B7_9ACTN|nr:SURF1 family protein [Streptomyces meridianus]MCM2577733.1 SURF1 family protein [Streptomyces meridianus]
MYRFLLTPRWWGINVFAVLAVPLCFFMGSWQLSRFEARMDSHRAEGNRTDRDRSAVPLDELLPVDRKTSGRLATATGRYEDQFLVPDRRLDDRRGFYVLTLLRTEGGKALPVVRGWLPGDARSDAAPPPPSGKVTVTGAVQASESQGADGVRSGGGLPRGQLGMISAASLVNLVPYPVHDAWITQIRTSGDLRAVPPRAPNGTGLDLKAFQNLGYTGEWFVFAGFVVFMWFRLFRREAEAQRDLALGLPAQEPGHVTVSGPPAPKAVTEAADPETAPGATAADDTAVRTAPGD